jgi:nicotinamidase-related amidase
MKIIEADKAGLLLVDFQSRLMPAIADAAPILSNAMRLLKAAAVLGVPAFFTEQNPKGLGATVESLEPSAAAITHKMTFNACRAEGFVERLAGRRQIVVAGCEAHVCVLQTVFGLLEAGFEVYLASDAVGSRRAESKEMALGRMARHGADIVTSEMVIFEWLGSCEHPAFKQVLPLVK